MIEPGIIPSANDDIGHTTTTTTLGLCDFRFFVGKKKYYWINVKCTQLVSYTKFYLR